MMMLKLVIILLATAVALFTGNKLIDKWLDIPGADFNKLYDKTML
jgi:hypothetical protein